MTQPPQQTAPYAVPAARCEVEYVIKKSRFIAWACPAANREQALEWLDQARQTFPDARHHCWAYLIGPPHSPATAATSDDGEPSGTAGKPILNVLQHKDVGDLMLIVIRYFGGIKLGAGGLVRAYSHAAQLAMDELTLTTKKTLIQSRVSLAFELENELRRWLDQHEGHLLSVDYSHQVNVECSFPSDHQNAWQDFIQSQGMTPVE